MGDGNYESLESLRCGCPFHEKRRGRRDHDKTFFLAPLSQQSRENSGQKMSRVLLPFQKSTNMGSTILTEFNNVVPFPPDANGRRPSDMSKRAPFPFPFPSLFLLLRLSETHFPPELTSSFCAESERYKGNRKEGNSDFRGRRRSNGARKKAIFRQERRREAKAAP